MNEPRKFGKLSGFYYVYYVKKPLATKNKNIIKHNQPNL